MEEYISRTEHNEFAKRMEDEHKRQNHRIDEVQKAASQIGELTLSVKELAMSVKNMSEDQKALRDDMEVVKNRDGEMWRKVVGYAVTSAIGILVGFIFSQIGIV